MYLDKMSAQTTLYIAELPATRAILALQGASLSRRTSSSSVSGTGLACMRRDRSAGGPGYTPLH